MTSGELEHPQGHPEHDTLVDSEPQLRWNPLFLEVLSLQFEYSGRAIPKAEAHAFWRDNEDIARLNTLARQEKLVGEKVSLSGEGVIEPKVTMNVINDTAHIAAKEAFDAPEDSFEASINPPRIKGSFKGFDLRFKTNYEADMFIPVITYKVSTGTSRTPYASIESFASGDVGVSILEFDKDTFNETARRLLDAIKALAPEYGEELDNLAIVLAEDPLKVEHVSYAAYKSKEILEDAEQDDKQKLEDALSDLVLHYLKRTPAFKIKTPSYLVSDNERSVDSKRFISTPSSPRVFNQPVRTVTFMDQYALTERGPRRIGQRALHIVLSDDDDDALTYVPVHEMTEFSKA